MQSGGVLWLGMHHQAMPNGLPTHEGPLLKSSFSRAQFTAHGSYPA